MSTTTTNLGLVKPALTDTPDITAMNPNWDKIDSLLAGGTGSTGTNSHAEGLNTIASAAASHAEGNTTTASSDCAHAEGNGTVASGTYSHAEGQLTIASGIDAHAEGNTTKAYAHNSHAEGYLSQAGGSSTDPTVGRYAHAEGVGTHALYDATHAEGDSSIANGYASHAEGLYTTSSGYASHAEGSGTKAITPYTHAEGRDTIAFGQVSHTEGHNSVADVACHAEGAHGYAGNAALKIVTAIDSTNHTLTLDNVNGLSVGDYVDIKVIIRPTLLAVQITAINGFVITLNTTADLTYSEFVLKRTNVNYPSHVEGLNCISIGECSHAEGQFAIAYLSGSHAEGTRTRASGLCSHAEGDNCTASNTNSHAEGYGTLASGVYAHAEGYGITASGESSHAEGYSTIASGSYAHAEGSNCTASGPNTHVGGDSCTASAYASFAHGAGVTASGVAQTVFGMFNASNTTDLFQIGGGTSDSARSNAFIVTSTGNIWHKVDRGSTSDITVNSGWTVAFYDLTRIGRLVRLRAGVTKTDGSSFTTPRSVPFTINTAKFRPAITTSFKPINAATYKDSFMDRIVNCLVENVGTVDLDACFGYTDVKQALIDIWYEGQ